MSQERTFIMIKPDGVQRGFVGEIIKRFEQKGYKLLCLKMMNPTRELIMEHYKHLKDKPYYPTMIKYMSSGPVVCMVMSGLNAVKAGRALLGQTDPQDSGSGTIRGDFCITPSRTCCHGSDSVENAEIEIALWFKQGEILGWESCFHKWLYE